MIVSLAVVFGGPACTSFGTEPDTPGGDGGAIAPGDASLPLPKEDAAAPSAFRNDPSLRADAFVAVTAGTSACKYNPGAGPYCQGNTQASHTCALRNDGRVACWGASKSGRLGVVPPNDAPEATWSTTQPPTFVPGLPAPATAITAGADHTCALLSDKAVFCWGYNWNGQLGRGEGQEGQPRAGAGQPPGRLTLQTTGTVKEVVAGQGHTCVLFESGDVECVGKVNDKETSAFQSRKFQKISLGWKTSCGVTVAGELVCSGDSASNQITTSSSADATTLLGAATDVSVGYGHICARLGPSARPQCWGNCVAYGDTSGPSSGCPRLAGNRRALPGVGSNSTIPTALDAGGAHTCWIEGSNAYCIGASASGEAGTTEQVRSMPGDPIVKNVRAITASGSHTCAVTSAGEVHCWGNNEFGQLGSNGPSSDVATKVVFPPAG